MITLNSLRRYRIAFRGRGGERRVLRSPGRFGPSCCGRGADCRTRLPPGFRRRPALRSRRPGESGRSPPALGRGAAACRLRQRWRLPDPTVPRQFRDCDCRPTEQLGDDTRAILSARIPCFTARRVAGLCRLHSRRLLGSPGVSRRLNRPALADHLCQRWPQVEETYFESIKRMAPGSGLSSKRAARLERHWDRFSGPVDFLTASEADRFDEQLARAVSRCFGNGRTGIFLSGGFDSVSVAAVAADHARHEATGSGRALARIPPSGVRRAPAANISGAQSWPAARHAWVSWKRLDRMGCLARVSN